MQPYFLLLLSNSWNMSVYKTIQYNTQYQIRSYKLKEKEKTKDRFIHSCKPSRMYRSNASRKGWWHNFSSFAPEEAVVVFIDNIPSALFLGLHICISAKSWKVSQSSGNRFLRYRNAVVLENFTMSKHTVTFWSEIHKVCHIYFAWYFFFMLKLLTDPCDALLQKYLAEKSDYRKLE